jgi:hypothetical protein
VPATDTETVLVICTHQSPSCVDLPQFNWAAWGCLSLHSRWAPSRPTPLLLPSSCNVRCIDLYCPIPLRIIANFEHAHHPRAPHASPNPAQARPKARDLKKWSPSAQPGYPLLDRCPSKLNSPLKTLFDVIMSIGTDLCGRLRCHLCGFYSPN